MILLIILIIVAIVGLFLAMASEHFNEPISTPVFGVGMVCLIISFIVLLCCALNGLSVENDRKEIYKEYESIIIYQPMVEKSSDITLHWRHRERVKEWNREYEEYEKERANIFCGLLFRPNIYKDCSTIEFESPFESEFLN